MNRILKFAGVGIVTTLFDYVTYSLLVMICFGGDTSKVAVAMVISGILATFVAYVLHSKITWKEKNPGKFGVLKFFAWNIAMSMAIRPVLTSAFETFDALYQFAFSVATGIHLPFSYEFVHSTGIYALTILVVMILNFLFYGKVVFGEPKAKDGEEVEMDSVGKARKEKQSQTKAKTNRRK